MKISDYKLDMAKLDAGVWWDFTRNATCPGNAPHATNPCFLVYSSVTGRYFAEVAERQRPHFELLRKPLPEGEPERSRHLREIDPITRRTRAEAIAATPLLGGWVNLEDDAGNPIEFSAEAAVRYLSDPAYQIFLTFVERCADNIESVLAAEEEDARKN